MNRIARLVVLSAAAVLAACGGGGGSDGTTTAATGPQSPSSTPAGVAFAAFGSSASTASLGWARPAGSATYVIERKSTGGDWVAVASVDARSGSYLDSGLAALTDYSYRLVDVGATRTTLAESATRTSEEQPVTTAVGGALAQAATTTVGTAGGQLASPDGAIVVHVPAGAFPADTQASAQPVTNTAPDGRGDGLTVRLDAAPRIALTLTLRYDAAQDAEADGQRIAVQRADGSWLSLPLTGLDRTTRTLSAELPPSWFSTTASATGKVTTQAAVPRGASEFVVIRYLAYYLKPRQAQVEVKKSLQLRPVARVRGTDRTAEVCGRDAEIDCVTVPVMTEREIDVLNDKAGYDRRWSVSGVDGGNATFGTVATSGSVGATFTAPDSKPNPSTVTASFKSRNLATGRTVTLSARIEITDGRWAGTMSSENGPSDAGTTFFATARVDWEADDAASTATRKVYRGTGDVDVVVADDDCVVSVSPSNQPMAASPQLVELAIDENASPMTYTARLITFWPATLSSRCPQGNASQSALAGYGWDVSGVVSDDGRRIEGRTTDANGAKVEWLFTR